MPNHRSAAGSDLPPPQAALLEVAFQVFAGRGYRATRLDDVAQAAGVTKGAIYYYFESKEDLLRRAVLRRHDTLFEGVGDQLRGERAPASARIRLALRTLWAHWLEPGWGDALRLMIGEVSLEFPSLFRMWAEVGPLRAGHLVGDLIEEGKAAGEFRPDADADVAARLLVSGLMLQAAMHVHLGLSDLAPCHTDRLFDSSVEVVLRGLSSGTNPRGVDWGAG